MPAEVTNLVERLVEQIEAGPDLPDRPVKEVRQLEITAARVGYWAPHDTHKDTPPDQAAAALGLSVTDTHKLPTRYGRWIPTADQCRSAEVRGGAWQLFPIPWWFWRVLVAGHRAPSGSMT
ncbi:hypothetical protein [Streptomyces sp. NPDC058623]|uniref:hypothetical protein n=1 Tax=Streptomyces sp. NPDC058623 TaxID=3346563 RepID=UPI003654F9C0